MLRVCSMYNVCTLRNSLCRDADTVVLPSPVRLGPNYTHEQACSFRQNETWSRLRRHTGKTQLRGAVLLKLVMMAGYRRPRRRNEMLSKLVYCKMIVERIIQRGEEGRSRQSIIDAVDRRF